jgi:serine/threonine-protein kinase RsbW
MSAVVRIPADVEQLAQVRRFTRERAGASGLGGRALEDLVCAVDEGATNMIVHGARDGGGPIEVEVRRQGEAVVVRLRDRAPVFDPTGRPEPNLDAPLEARRLGGMGVHLMRTLTDEFRHVARRGGGNVVTLVKRLGPGAKGGHDADDGRARPR